MPKKTHRKRRGKFVAQPKHPVTGRRLYLSCDTERELEARLQRLRELARDYEFGAAPEATSRALRPALGKILTAEEAWTRYVATMRPSARRRAEAAWQNHLRPWFRTLRAHELTADVMAAWLLDLRCRGGVSGHGRAPNTIWLAYDMFAASFARLVGTELTALPWGKWRPALPRGTDGVLRRRACLRSFPELVRLIAAAREMDADAWARGQYSALAVTVAVLCLTGMRQAEAAGLAWDSVELTDAPLLHIHYQAPRGWRLSYPGAPRPPAIPKGKRKRTQVLHTSAALALLEQRAELERRGWLRAEGPVFPSPRTGSWRDDGTVIRPPLMRAIVLRAGLPNPHLWTVHSTRHSFATLEGQALQGDLAALRERTGHASVAQLEGYYHPGPSRMLPELPPGLVSRALDAPGVEMGTLERPALTARVQIESKGGPKAVQIESKNQDEPPETWLELARAWLTAPTPGKDGRPLSRPPAVSDRARHVQRRAYKKAMKAGQTPEQASAAGKRARAGALTAWKRVLVRAARERET